MILEPRKAALTDEELAELLRNVNREFRGDEPESYASPSAPYWKKRIAFVALAGLMAMSAGFSAAISTVRERPAAPPKHVRPAARSHHRALSLPVRHAIAPPLIPARRMLPIYVPPPPSETLARHARVALLHEEAAAAQAARAHHEAQLAMRARAQANEQALEQALAQARAQARAEAIAQARAQQVEAAQQQALLDNARDAGIKPGAGVPPTTGHMGTIPSPSNPVPAPGPVLDPNCTPHRGAFFNSMLDNVRVGGTNVGTILRLIHHP